MESWFSSYFEPRIRKRGETYHRQGRVTLVRIDEDEIRAKVKGTRTYTVELVGVPGGIECVCNCPYAEDGGTCKHIWATILTAELDPDGSDWLNEQLWRKHTTHAKQASPPPSNRVAESASKPPVPRSNNGGSGRKPGESPPRPAPPAWKRHFRDLATQLARADTARHPQTPDAIRYLISPDPLSMEVGSREPAPRTVEITVESATRKKNGELGVWRQFRGSGRIVASLPSIDRAILERLKGGREPWSSAYFDYADATYVNGQWMIAPEVLGAIGPEISALGSLWLGSPRDDLAPRPVTWDDAGDWNVTVIVHAETSPPTAYQVRTVVERDGERLDLPAVGPILCGPYFHRAGHISRLAQESWLAWIPALVHVHGLLLSPEEGWAFVETIMSIPFAPIVEAPEELAWTDVQEPPRPCLHFHLPGSVYGGEQGPFPPGALKSLAERAAYPREIFAELSFDYGGIRIGADHPATQVPLPEQRTRILRDPAAEDAAMRLLLQLGARRDVLDGQALIVHRATEFPALVPQLIAAGWLVDAEGKPVRIAGAFDLQLHSGVDWFELSGAAQFDSGLFGEQKLQLPLPELLRAARSGANTVLLDDGSLGVLPQEWWERYAALAETGMLQEDALRFRPQQLALLDALLEMRPEIGFDEAFAQARERLHAFERIRPIDPPAGFQGSLRPYQKESLAWFEFLRDFGFGGCLADDMGLGKTIMVLALLERRRTRRDVKAPSLIVVPRSLIFNWISEAARFTPKLRVLDYTGTQRGHLEERLPGHHVVLTTYGTVRREVIRLQEIAFDYVILDESQAIKNYRTAIAKAVRLLTCENRLALSGTPIENRLLELWSLFEFLNPGMLGSAKAFESLAARAESRLEPLSVERATGRGSNGTPPPADSGPLALESGGLHVIARSVRPFVLRRTKQQVVSDLPPKTEQTVYCELTKKQRKQYDELREYYRALLLGKIETDGWQRVKFTVLEALLRLRQAACHSGLIDPARSGEPSAKVDLAVDRITELVSEGHKVLVFSQFTRFLAIVRRRLDEAQITYEYLDGRTRNRGEKVQRFQSEPAVPVFLISLKAGGVGLNLTAAEHVILLDPWWNPAVEAQAIDRAHRIGQTRPVLAWRIVARDTVEERILQLQEAKRSLADAIIQADRSLVQDLRREDLELLLR